MSSVPATFKVWRAQHHDKLTLLTFGRKIYSFYFHSTWCYLLFSHLGVDGRCFTPFVFSPWYSPGKLDLPTPWPPGPPWMTKSLWVAPRTHTNTHMHAHMHRHTARNANICINYKRENWKYLLPKGARVYWYGFLIIILTCCHKQKTLVLSYIISSDIMRLQIVVFKCFYYNYHELYAILLHHHAILWNVTKLNFNCSFFSDSRAHVGIKQLIHS